MEATQEADVGHTQATNIFNMTTSGGYSLMDTSTLHQLHQVQMSNIMSQPHVALFILNIISFQLLNYVHYSQVLYIS